MRPFSVFIRIVAGLLALGFVYFAVVRVTGYGMPCVFRIVTGYLCPGCGMTRAVIAISRLDFKTAFEQNALSLTVFPAIGMYVCYKGINLYNTGEKVVFKSWEKILFLVLIIATAIYSVFRNL